MQTSTSNEDTQELVHDLTNEQRAGLAAAWELITAGVPVFLARPDATTKMGFALPPGWQHTAPDVDVLSRWRPGDALCAVMGSTLDLIDVDPRSGGNDSLAQLSQAGLIPTVYGRASTPSGGVHLFVAAMGEASLDYASRDGKTQGVAPGVDIKGGAADGTGRGFAFIAPTVRTSKATGEPGTYVWQAAPDSVHIETEVADDDSGAALAEVIRADRARRASVNAAGAGVMVADAGDPFQTGIPGRTFSREQATAFYMPHFEAYRAMTDADVNFNIALNELAVIVGHFVPEFMTAERAVAVLYEASVHNGSVAYQGESAVRSTINSGLKKGMSEPYFLGREDGGAAEAINAETPSLDPVDLLMGELLTAADLEDMPNPKPLVRGVLDLDSACWMIGKSGSYKSFVALDLAGCVATGRPWHGHEVTQGNVLYLVAEGSKGIKLRMRAWQRVYGRVAERIWFLPRPVQAKGKDWAALVEACRRIEPVLVIIDTQARVTVGLQENDNSEMGLYVEAADAIKRATGACVLTVHHIGRNGLDARGASAIDGAQDTELRVERTEDRHVAIKLDKQKDGDDSEAIELGLLLVDGGTDAETGRDLSSLAVVDKNMVAHVPRPAEWQEAQPGAQAEVLAVVLDVFGLVGGTKAEVRTSLAEQQKAAGRPAMPKSTFNWAWNQLVAIERLVRVEGAQRWVGVPRPDDLVEAAGSAIPMPRDGADN